MISNPKVFDSIHSGISFRKEPFFDSFTVSLRSTRYLGGRGLCSHLGAIGGDGECVGRGLDQQPCDLDLTWLCLKRPDSEHLRYYLIHFIAQFKCKISEAESQNSGDPSRILASVQVVMSLSSGLKGGENWQFQGSPEPSEDYCNRKHTCLVEDPRLLFTCQCRWIQPWQIFKD